MSPDPHQLPPPPEPAREEPEPRMALIWQLVIGALIAFVGYTGVFVAGMFDVPIAPPVWIAIFVAAWLCIFVCLRHGLRGVIAGMALGGFATYVGYKLLSPP